MADWLFPDGRLLLFARAPVRGRVKTRLQSTWGRRGALRIYQQLFRQTLGVAVASRVAPVEIWCAPGCGHPWVRARAREAEARLRAQPAGGLGERMQGAFRETLRRAPYAVIVGADCAALGPGAIRAAFERLAAGDDAVFVPAHDGGYALIGLRAVDPALFTNVPWGSSAVMGETNRRLRRLGWRSTRLAPVSDVDHPADVHHLRQAGVLRMW
ncbi:TIGR04282 family arsenosugar biosynthesis glycosyltransferase [Aquisalimonas asiatica]|uniref:Glycosyltransferase n=1 Tax=Aquisalimonas asiatica TaxID=406100 RepID=A0A1H8QTR4_9GAMM|nr:TIGR04282 family arsenosugar biosynthesis glycosyltransferase [Aquisalimonas asiatica]SEO57565.1 hypothetical protein SAMN04488052_101781 [Aquisalimonas asiatica]